jgi:flagellar M-ring protein FliF
MSSPAVSRQALGWFRRFTTRQLVTAGLLLTLVVGGTVALASWAMAPTYAVLFTGLDASSAAAVTSQLEADGVPYQLEAGGSTVKVPAEQVDTTRISLAAANLPATGTVGYELMDSQSITTDSFTQQINYQRALEGELSRTLTAIDGVSAARVQIVLPEERLFTDAETPARAAVLLTTSRMVTDENVAAVVNLVSSSVPNLDPANVTVTDSTGRQLTSPGSGTGAGSTEQRKAQADYETKLEQQAVTMLSPVTGPGRAVVRVSADMDFTQRSRATEEYDPDRSAAKETASSSEQYRGEARTPGGTLTTEPGANDEPQEASETQEYTKTSESASLNNTKTISQEIEAPGKVQRLTVSVLLDTSAAQALSAEQVQALVANAVGLDTERGDAIVVDYAPFDTSAQAAAEQTAAAAAAKAEEEARSKMIVAAAIGIPLLLGVIVLAVFLFRGRRTPISQEDLAAATAALPLTLPHDPDPDPTAVHPQLQVPDRADEAAQLRSRVTERPGDAANAIRGLMASDRVGSGK